MFLKGRPDTTGSVSTDQSFISYIVLVAPPVYPFLVLFIYLFIYLLFIYCVCFQVPTEGEKKRSQSSVVTVIHMEGLDKLNKVINNFIIISFVGKI
jgi:hypothetical protein